MTKIFYRNVIEAGGTQEEAMRLTQVFIAASILNGNNGKKEDANGGANEKF